jgi:TrmH family RNA methyltransferase
MSPRHPAALDPIAVVLVRPQGDGNVGQAARAMKNFGLSRLLLVQPCNVDTDFCRQMAPNAYEIVERAEHHTTLTEALAGFEYVVGTSRRIGKFRPRFSTARALPGWLLPRLTGDKTAALVFGNEADGLSNEELDVCARLVEVETDPAHRSLNLAQAVCLVAYELFAAAVETPGELSPHRPASHGILERMFAQMRRMYLEIGFLAPQNPDAIMRTLRRLFLRAEPDEREVRILRGIMQDTEWYLDHVAKTGVRDGYREVAGHGQPRAGTRREDPAD